MLRGNCCHGIYERLTRFAARSGEAGRAVADAGHVVTRRVVEAATDVRAVDAVVRRRRAGVLAERSYPAGSTGALAAHQVAVCVVLTLARLVAVGAVLALVALCKYYYYYYYYAVFNAPYVCQSMTKSQARETRELRIRRGVIERLQFQYSFICLW